MGGAPPPPGWGAAAGLPAWHPSAQGHPHLHLLQDANTSLYAHRNGGKKPVSGREGALRFAPGVLLGPVQGNLVTLSWGEARPGTCGELHTLAGCLHTRPATKLSLSFPTSKREPSLSSGQSSVHTRVCMTVWSQ